VEVLLPREENSASPLKLDVTNLTRVHQVKDEVDALTWPIEDVRRSGS
jgi:hypothetical protein